MIYSTKKYTVLVVCIVTVLLVSWLVSGGWFGKKFKLVESTDYLMSTSITVKVYVRNARAGEALLQNAFAEAKRIEHIMEPLVGDGELHRINETSSVRTWKLSDDLRTVLERALYYSRLSQGAFDPTIAAVKWTWAFEEGGRLPSEEEIAEALETVGFSQVVLKSDSLEMKKNGTKLDLGGVAKGYAVDRMIAILRQGGAEAGLVNAGGDIFTFGKKPSGKDWVIGLRHPRTKRNFILKTIALHAVATSGDYERYFMCDGVRYHHILDPETGYPARGCASVTVWTSLAMDADALATAIFVMGPQKGLELAEKLEGVETLIFFEENNVVKTARSSGVRDIIPQ